MACALVSSHPCVTSHLLVHIYTTLPQDQGKYSLPRCELGEYHPEGSVENVQEQGRGALWFHGSE